MKKAVEQQETKITTKSGLSRARTRRAAYLRKSLTKPTKRLFAGSPRALFRELLAVELNARGASRMTMESR